MEGLCWANEDALGGASGEADGGGDSPGMGGSSDEGGGGHSGNEPACSGWTADPVPWFVPHPSVREAQGASALGAHLVLDLHGDGLPDLVVTHPPSNSGPEGSSAFVDAQGPHWWIYRNTGEGFAEQPERWSVPHVSVSTTAGVHATGWGQLLDLEGNGRPDLVYTGSQPVDQQRAFGNADQPHWLIHDNDGAGFQADARPWSVPHRSFARTAGLAAPGQFVLMDLRGRGRADLVVTRPPPFDASETFGDEESYWLVYENDSDGFVERTMRWSVPHRTLVETFGESALGLGVVISLRGRGAPDLVVTRPPNVEEAFSQSRGPGWFVFPNTGSGFENERLPWAVPHRSVAHAAGSTNLGRTSVLDLRAQGRSQLVVTHPPGSDRAFGETAHWLVYDSDENGFVEQPEPFFVPHPTVADLSGSSALGEHLLLNLDQGDCPSLVVTRPPNSDVAFGNPDQPHWLIYRPM